MSRMAGENVYINVPAKTRQNKDFEIKGRQRRSVTVERAALVVLSLLLLVSVSALVGVLSVNRPCQLKSGAKEENKTLSTSAGSEYYSPLRNTSEASTETTTVPTTTKQKTTVSRCVVPCGADWELHGTKCYRFSSSRLTWTDSRAECQSLSGHLVKIESREEQTFVFNKLIKGDRFWIGLTDSENEGDWKWTDGSPLDQSLTFWMMEPDNYDVINPKGEDCAIILLQPGLSEDRSWADVSCIYPQRFICEKEPICK